MFTSEKTPPIVLLSLPASCLGWCRNMGRSGKARRWCDMLAVSIAPHVDNAWRELQVSITAGYSKAKIFSLHTLHARMTMETGHYIFPKKEHYLAKALYDKSVSGPCQRSL